MRQYKGYYIDKVIFSSKEDIDQFIKEQAIRAFKMATELFAQAPSMAHSILADEKAEVLVSKFGYTWEQVEELEIATLEAMA